MKKAETSDRPGLFRNDMFVGIQAEQTLKERSLTCDCLMARDSEDSDDNYHREDFRCRDCQPQAGVAENQRQQNECRDDENYAAEKRIERRNDNFLDTLVIADEGHVDGEEERADSENRQSVGGDGESLAAFGQEDEGESRGAEPHRRRYQAAAQNGGSKRDP